MKKYYNNFEAVVCLLCSRTSHSVQEACFSLNSHLNLHNFNFLQVLELFQEDEALPKFDNRITGSETVDSFLNEIITIIINDYVTPWYEILTNDEEFTNHAIKRLVLAAGANVANR